MADILAALQASARQGTLLSSCEPEVKELMHQLDVVISSKQREWEVERRSLLSRLDHKDRELALLRREVIDKKAEVDQLRVVSRSVEQEYHACHADQEAQLLRLRSEVKRLNHSYEQLKAKRSHSREKGGHCNCQSLMQQVCELQKGLSVMGQQVKRREGELALAEEDKRQKVSLLQESLRTKDELIRTLEEQMSLERSSVQFSSYEAELNQVREQLRAHMEEEQRLRRELQSSQGSMREERVVGELQDRVEVQLREAQSLGQRANLEQNNTAIAQFVNHADQLATSSQECVAVPTDTGLSHALEGILDKHFNQLDTSLQTILSSNK